MDGRFIIDGKLGCPICSASYPISEGVADLRDATSGVIANDSYSALEDDENAAMRIAAMLGLTRAGSVAVLSGLPAAIAGIVAELATARVIALNPATTLREEKENVAVVLSSDRFPLASGSIDGIILGTSPSSAEVAEAVRVLKTGGRLVVPADTPLGGNLRQLARDDRYIVAESTGPLIGLSR